ncbi:hypothetical protein [Streptomyces sp. NPDC002779]
MPKAGEPSWSSLNSDSGFLESLSQQWGWVNNVYITGDEHLAGVSDCAF